MTKKIFAMFLAVLMVVSLLPTSVFADTAEREYPWYDANGCKRMHVKATDLKCPAPDCGKSDYVLQEHIEANCGHEGGLNVKCSGCGKEYFVESEKTVGEHAWVDVAEKAPVACAHGVKAHRECAVCGREEVKNAKGNWVEKTEENKDIWQIQNADELKVHTYNNTTGVICGVEGKTTLVCSVCGEKKEVTTKKNYTHTWGEPKVTKEPTATEKGKANVQCTTCYLIKEVTVFFKHDHVAVKVAAKDPTCTKTGLDKDYWYCKVCGQTYQDENCTKVLPKEQLEKIKLTEKEIAKLTEAEREAYNRAPGYTLRIQPHAFPESTKCTDTTAVCVSCHVRYEINPAKIKVVNESEEDVTNAWHGGHKVLNADDELTTMTFDGCAAVKCAVCEKDVTLYDLKAEKDFTAEEAAQKHNWDITEAKCFDQKRTCKTCGATETLAAVDHHVSNCDSQLARCDKGCNKTAAELGLKHEWVRNKDENGKDVKDTKATCTIGSYYDAHCKYCDQKKKIEVSAALGHALVTTTIPATCLTYEITFTYCTRANCPSTGTELRDYLRKDEYKDAVGSILDGQMLPGLDYVLGYTSEDRGVENKYVFYLFSYEKPNEKTGLMEAKTEFKACVAGDGEEANLKKHLSNIEAAKGKNIRYAKVIGTEGTGSANRSFYLYVNLPTDGGETEKLYISATKFNYSEGWSTAELALTKKASTVFYLKGGFLATDLTSKAGSATMVMVPGGAKIVLNEYYEDIGEYEKVLELAYAAGKLTVLDQQVNKKGTFDKNNDANHYYAPYKNAVGTSIDTKASCTAASTEYFICPCGQMKVTHSKPATGHVDANGKDTYKEIVGEVEKDWKQVEWNEIKNTEGLTNAMLKLIYGSNASKYKWDDELIAAAANCQSKGWYFTYCIKCGDVQIHWVDLKEGQDGHKFEEDLQAGLDHETTQKFFGKTCTVPGCGYKAPELVSWNGKDYSTDGYVYADKEKANAAHPMGGTESKQIVAPSCAAVGVYEYTCSCGSVVRYQVTKSTTEIVGYELNEKGDKYEPVYREYGKHYNATITRFYGKNSDGNILSGTEELTAQNYVVAGCEADTIYSYGCICEGCNSFRYATVAKDKYNETKQTAETKGNWVCIEQAYSGTECTTCKNVTDGKYDHKQIWVPSNLEKKHETKHTWELNPGYDNVKSSCEESEKNNVAKWYCSVCNDIHAEDFTSFKPGTTKDDGYKPQGNVTNATCGHANYELYTCGVCGELHVRNYSAPVHEYVKLTGKTSVEYKENGKWTTYNLIEKKATCTKEGYYFEYCPICNPNKDSKKDNKNLLKKVIIAKKPHKNAQGEFFTDACTDTVTDRHCVTCCECKDTHGKKDADGKVIHDCAIGKKDEKTGAYKPCACIIGNAHNWESVVVKPTCTEGGYTYFACACGAEKTDDNGDLVTMLPTEPAGHRPTYVTADKRKDSYYGFNYDQSFLDKNGVTKYYENLSYTAPTADMFGSRTYICHNCKETVTEQLPKLGGLNIKLNQNEATFGSLITITVSLENMDEALSSITLIGNVPSNMKFVSVKSLNKAFWIATEDGETFTALYTKNGNYIAEGSSELAEITYRWTGKVATENNAVTFEMSAKYLDENDYPQTVTFDVAESAAAAFATVKFGDYTKDDKINEFDVRKALELITLSGESDYSASMDANFDGVIDLLDLKTMLNINVIKNEKDRNIAIGALHESVMTAAEMELMGYHRIICDNDKCKTKYWCYLPVCPECKRENECEDCANPLEEGTYTIKAGDVEAGAWKKQDDKTYGYIYAPESGARAGKYTFEIVEGGYVIKTAEGKYLYNGGQYSSFELKDELKDATIWTVEKNDDETYTVSYGNRILCYSTHNGYNNFCANTAGYKDSTYALTLTPVEA